MARRTCSSTRACAALAARSSTAAAARSAARNLIAEWGRGAAGRFIKVMPRDYRRALAEQTASGNGTDAHGRPAVEAH